MPVVLARGNGAELRLLIGQVGQAKRYPVTLAVGATLADLRAKARARFGPGVNANRLRVAIGMAAALADLDDDEDLAELREGDVVVVG